MARKQARTTSKGKRQRIEPKMGDETGPGLLPLRLGPQDRTTANSKSKSGAGKGSKSISSARRTPKRKAGRNRRAGRKRQHPSFSLFSLLRRGIYWSAVMGVWALVAVAGVLAYSAATLPQISKWSIPERPPNVRILDAKGELLANRGDTGGEAVRLETLPPHLIEAVIAIEDRRYAHHFGIDPIGLTRAMISNLRAGHIVQGGSTLTQQLAKNLFLEPDRTLERKLQEVVLALWLEANHSKEEILEMYLNRVYFGSGAYGVDAAARRYFSKPARQVTIGEAATLAGLLKAPSRFAPTRNPEQSRARAGLVLAAMADQGYITRQEAQIARAAPSTVVARYSSSSIHYAADWIMSEVDSFVTSPDGDIVVHTTIDRDLQLAAERSLRAVLAKDGQDKNVTQGALVVLDRNGAVRAVVGGRDYGTSPFNRAIDAKRQPGSAFKPFVYLAAMERGLLPEDVRIDRKVTVRGWTPSNYKDKYLGPVSLRTALAKSANTVAVQLASEVGAGQVVRTAERLGIRSKLTANPSLALGTSEVTPLELASAYVPFSNGGREALPHVIARIERVGGSVLYEKPSANWATVIDGQSLYKMNDMMGAVMAYGTGRAAQLEGHPAGGKSGTSQQSRDAWFVGYTAYYTAAVWLGNDNNKPMRKVTGGSLPAHVWQSFMAVAHEDLRPAPLPGNNQAIYSAAAAEHVPMPRPRGTAAVVRAHNSQLGAHNGQLRAQNGQAQDPIGGLLSRRPPAALSPAVAVNGSADAARPATDNGTDPVGRFILGLFGRDES